MKKLTPRLGLAILLSSAALASATAPITTESLLGDLVDLERLARLADSPYTTRQASSYDRTSKSPTEGWFGNFDYDQFIRVEERNGRQEYVMMDASGPGTIVRIWSANPKGTLRIYLDGSEQPVIEEKMESLLGGSVAGFPVPLAGRRAKGWNLYFPIPYVRHCKLTTDEGGSFYHVNYRTYEPGTQVVTFVADDLVRLKTRIHALAEQLAAPLDRVALPKDLQKESFAAQLSPDQEQIIGKIAGPKAIREIRCTLHAGDLQAAARGVVLRVSFDDEQTVECPLGDFFGTAPGLNPYLSLPMGITNESAPVMYCRWVMPFQKIATLSVKNTTSQSVQLSGSISTVPWEWDDRSLHLHARWRQQKRLPTTPFSDWTHLECSGQGRFVGGGLHLQNPRLTWWGEGDEKIYVDGETFPSHFGTGSEDYYGYAYCASSLFTHAYHNQTRCDGPGNFGNTAVNRFHIIDDIPFNRSFKFDMENWNAAEDTYTNRAAVSYWYARPGGKSFFEPLTAADLVVEPIKLFKVAGSQEAESMPVLEKSAGRAVKVYTNANERWSGGIQLVWSEARPGEFMTLGFDSPTAGKKNVIVNLTRSPNHGIFRFKVNGRKTGNPIDLYAPTLSTTGPLDLGTYWLSAGQNRLTVEIVGSNKAASKTCFLGLDYIQVK